MIIELGVVPNSKRFSISVKDDRLRVCLKSAPENNKANLELVRELSGLLRCDVTLVAGQASRRKKLEIAMSEEEWAGFLTELQKRRE